MGILSRFRFRWTKRQRLLFEVGIAILCVILFLGVLNTITYSQKVVILTTEDLWKYADNIAVTFWYMNMTSRQVTTVTYSLSDVATFYGGALYFSVPQPPSGYDVLYFVAVKLGNLTWGELVEKGLNRVELLLYIKNSSVLQSIIGGKIELDYTYSGSNVMTLVSFKNVDEFYKLFAANETYRTFDIDTGALAVSVASKGIQSRNVWLGIWIKHVSPSAIEYIKLDIKLYAVSEKPVLKALTEPIYSVVSGLWAALLAFWRRFKTIVGSAFGGFSLSALFTGLIGDPVTAMILSIAIVTILFVVMRKGR